MQVFKLVSRLPLTVKGEGIGWVGCPSIIYRRVTCVRQSLALLFICVLSVYLRLSIRDCISITCCQVFPMTCVILKISANCRRIGRECFLMWTNSRKADTYPCHVFCGFGAAAKNHYKEGKFEEILYIEGLLADNKERIHSLVIFMCRVPVVQL